MSGFAADYIDVATRIAAIRGGDDKQYPEGSFQPLNFAEPFRIITLGETTYLAYTAAFYRTADDPRPGVGSAWEQVPGRTPYTRGSELQNAETSAWGRALVAALAADTKRGIASADEVRNRQAEQEADPLPRAPRSPGRTTRRTAAEVNAEPDPFTSPLTDIDWIDGFERRITAAGSAGEVRELWQEAVTVHGEGRLAEDDFTRLKSAMTDRARELTPQEVAS